MGSERTPKISRSATTFVGVYCVPDLCTRGVSSNGLDVAEVSGKIEYCWYFGFFQDLVSRAVPDLHLYFSESESCLTSVIVRYTIINHELDKAAVSGRIADSSLSVYTDRAG